MTEESAYVPGSHEHVPGVGPMPSADDWTAWGRWWDRQHPNDKRGHCSFEEECGYTIPPDSRGFRVRVNDNAKVTAPPILTLGEWKQVLAALVPYADMREIRDKCRNDLTKQGYLR